MTTVIPGLFQINGVVSTDKSVLQNINAICTAAGCWMTYDITEGKWSVIMNRAGSSVASFNDSNIIGGINISGKGISELYNSVTIEFPHKDLRDQTDYIDFDIAAGERFPNELDNKLNLSTDLANDPIQAQYIAGAELKQSRVDKVIQFRTDFSMLGLKAGDLIDVTASMYGYSSKVFRITKLEEDDSDVLQLSITALEYDADVYSTADLTRKIRTKKTGITPKAANQTLTSLDNKNNGTSLANAILADENLAATLMTLLGRKLNTALALTPAAVAHGLVLFQNQTSTGTIWKIGYQEAIPVYIDLSYGFITWTFGSPGIDLDIRATMVSPNVGQTTPIGYRDQGQISRWPASGDAYLTWGGDNTGTGTEGVLINASALKTAYPNNRYIVVECRGIWADIQKHPTAPVKLTGTLWQGGTPQPSGFVFENPGATTVVPIEGLTTSITVGFIDEINSSGPYAGLPNGNLAGQLIAYFVFDTLTFNAYFSPTNPAA